MPATGAAAGTEDSAGTSGSFRFSEQCRSSLTVHVSPSLGEQTHRRAGTPNAPWIHTLGGMTIPPIRAAPATSTDSVIIDGPACSARKR